MKNTFVDRDQMHVEVQILAIVARYHHPRKKTRRKTVVLKKGYFLLRRDVRVEGFAASS